MFPPYCRLARVGAAEVAAVFHDAEIDLSVLPHLNDHDLQVCHAAGTQHHGYPELAIANMKHGGVLASSYKTDGPCCLDVEAGV